MRAFTTNEALAQIQSAAQLLRKGRRSEALLNYEDVAQAEGNSAAVHLELGHFCSQLRALDQAIEHYKVAVQREPENAYYLGFLGVAYQQDGQLEEALDTLQRTMAINPDIPTVLNSLGLVYLARNNYIQAKAQLERATQLKPGDVTFRINYAVSLKHLDKHEEALEQAQKAVKQDPVNPYGHYVLGRILTESGRTDEAIRHFERTIRHHKAFGAAYDLLARIRKFTPADRPFIEKTEKTLGVGMPPDQRYAVHYALGKMYDDCGEWNKAFDHFRQANLLQKKPFDANVERRRFGKLKKAFDASALQRFGSFGHPSAQPVFIVGMPRSGTTLIEQMIASHPRGAGGDELQEMPRIAELLSPGDDSRRYASAMHGKLTPENIRRYAEQYLSVLRQGRESADRIVDKLPGNFFYLGLISILFPNATIIHAVRHPLDTCLSCYFQNFAQIQWANDFKLIAEIYRCYREVMAYWERVLPDGKILEVSYERVVESPEAQGRRLIEACGLEWDAGLLRFHEQERVVKTASVWQVRQPIYRSSRMRWKNYIPHLRELAFGLSDFLQDDREDLKAHGIDLPVGAGGRWLRRLIG